MTEPEQRVCAVCGRALDFYHGERVFKHAFQDLVDEDHPAVPVPVGEVPGRFRCDFCNTDKPVWRLPVTSFAVPGLPSSISEGDWATCDTCAKFISTNQWNALVEHNVKLRTSGPRQDDELPERVLRALLRKIYREVRSHRKGLLVPIPKEEQGV